MTPAFVTLPAEAPDPEVTCNRGVPLMPHAERRLHAPDCTILLIDGGSLVARCGCWWTGTAMYEGGRIGAIGHYAAATSEAGRTLLLKATDLLASRGASAAIGPMDGNTWRRYRFVVDRGEEPPFFLEPDNPDEWPAHWTSAGFVPLASYVSALDEDLRAPDPRTPAAWARLNAAGIGIRRWDPVRGEADLRRIFTLSLAAFERNFLYTPIAEDEFMTQYRAVLAHVRPELVLLAEKSDRLCGFVFALPDLLQSQRGGTIDTAIVKTVAVDPDFGGLGLGGVLVDSVRRNAWELGFRRSIHALMHENNPSRRISTRSGRAFRRYALFARRLTP